MGAVSALKVVEYTAARTRQVQVTSNTLSWAASIAPCQTSTPGQTQPQDRISGVVPERLPVSFSWRTLSACSST
jgi:hypothetical protein